MGYNPYALLTQTGYKQAFYNTAQSLVSLTHDFSWLTDGLTATVKGSFDAKNNAYQNRTRTPEQYGQAYIELLLVPLSFFCSKVVARLTFMDVWRVSFTSTFALKLKRR